MELNKKHSKALYVIPILVLGLFLLSFIPVSTPDNQEASTSDGIGYKGSVCTYVTRADGTVEDNGCDHNVLFNTGAEYVETQLKTGSTDAVDWISLCNSTAGCGEPQADSSELFTEYSSCGLTQVAGTTGSNGNGNWSVWTTFTASCDNLETNVTHLENDADLEFAGNSFTDVTLQTNDQLTINWTISVS